MGSYHFHWAHPASEVYVTGTFDNWGKTIKLDEKDGAHAKTVDLPITEDKILYKFVADGNWSHDHTAQSETDHEGNINNVLYPHDITPAPTHAHTISSVAPGASTTAMAGEQPIEAHSSVPGGFPETPRVTTNEKTLASNPLDDAKPTDSSAEQIFGVAPLPATGGIGNPIHLPAGAPVPDASTFTGNTLTSNVKLDQASYEKSDSGAPLLPPLSPQTEKEAAGAPIFGLGPQTTNMIPESSMGMGSDAPAPLEGAALSSAGPQSTTAQLAGQQPIQPRGVPEVVSESQKAAHVGPEASANSEAVLEKKQVEEELKSKIPEEQAGASSTSSGGITGAVAGGVAGLGAAAAGGAAYLRHKTHETTDTDPASVLPQSVQNSINGMNEKSGQASAVSGASVPQQNALGQGISAPATAMHARSGVPSEVTASQKQAHVGPEAASNPEAVQEKSAAEKELLSKVHKSEASGVPAPTAANALYAVPSEVTASQKQAHVGPEATANPEAVQEKSATEKELLSKISKSQAAGEPAPTATAATSSTAPTTTSSSGAPQLANPVGSGLAPMSMGTTSGLNAPASSQAQSSTASAAKPVVQEPAYDSRDVSPMSSPTGQAQPTVTTGVDSATAPATSKPVGTPRKTPAEQSSAGTPSLQKRNSIMNRLRGTPESSKSGQTADTADTVSASGEKKKKSFFGKIKEKLKK